MQQNTPYVMCRAGHTASRRSLENFHYLALSHNNPHHNIMCMCLNKTMHSEHRYVTGHHSLLHSCFRWLQWNPSLMPHPYIMPYSPISRSPKLPNAELQYKSTYSYSPEIWPPHSSIPQCWPVSHSTVLPCELNDTVFSPFACGGNHTFISYFIQGVSLVTI